MSVSNQTNKVSGAGNGVTVTFSFAFKIFDVSELYVYKTNNTTGVITGPLVYTTDFTAMISSVTEGGTVTFIVAPTVNETYLIKRIVPQTQSAVIPSEGTFPGKQMENQLDLLTMMIIQVNETVGRAFTVPITFTGTIPSLPTPQDGYAIGWLGTTGTMQNLLVDSATITAAVAAAAASAATATSAATTASTQATTATTQATAAAASAAAAAASALAKPYVKVTNTQSSGVSGGGTTSGSWLTAVLNTKDSDTGSIASLSTNILTLPAGTYLVSGAIPIYSTTVGNLAQARLFNNTGSAVLLNGTSIYGNGSIPWSLIRGVIVLAGSTNVLVQYQTVNTQATNGQGAAASFGTEVYAVMEFTKIA